MEEAEVEAMMTVEVATVEEEVTAVVGADTVADMTTGAADVGEGMAVQVVAVVVRRSRDFSREWPSSFLTSALFLLKYRLRRWI